MGKIASVVGSSVTYVDDKVTVTFPLPGKLIAVRQIQVPVLMNVDALTIFSTLYGQLSVTDGNPLFNYNLKMPVSPAGSFSAGTATVTATWFGSIFVLPTSYLKIQVAPGSQYDSLPDASQCILFFEVID
jgi:hypothetical protein